MRRAILQLFVAVCLSSCAEAQRPLTVITARPDGKLFMLPVAIDGSSQWFTWDTGDPSLVIDPRLARLLKLRSNRTDSISGTGTGEVSMSHASPVAVRIGTEHFTVADPWIIDLSGVPISKEVRGLIGADLWTRYAVRMNSQRHTLELFRAGRYEAGPDEVALPLIVLKNKMYVDVTLDVKPGVTRTERVRVDTGSEESVNSPTMGEAAETRVSTLGGGLGADFQSVSGRILAVHIGPFTVSDVWGPGGKGPSIGMEMLRRFVVTFDARAGKMYLKPTPALSELVPPPGK